jgi:hypothetical protein
VSYKKI